MRILTCYLIFVDMYSLVQLSKKFPTDDASHLDGCRKHFKWMTSSQLFEQLTMRAVQTAQNKKWAPVVTTNKTQQHTLYYPFRSYSELKR